MSFCMGACETNMPRGQNVATCAHFCVCVCAQSQLPKRITT